MGPLAALVLALAAAHVQVADGSLQKCYVCVPRGGDASLSDLFHDQLPVLKCEHFKKDDPGFVKTCPKEYQGCLTQSAGHHVTRTCGDLKIDDCSVANGVQYCYCSGELCNGHYPPPEDDDEDLSEGSGKDVASQEPKQTSGTPPTTPTTVAPPTTHAHQVKSAATRTNTKLATVLLCLVAVVGLLRRD